MSAAAPLLALDGVGKSFGGVRVIRDLGFAVARGQTVGLIGPNGAGKTTAFNIVSGVFRPDAGKVTFDGRDITSVPSRRRIALGIARSFQNVRLMQHLTVWENLLVGQHVRTSGLVDLLTPFRPFRNHRWRQEAVAALAEMGLDGYADAMVGELPYGIRKRIDLVRATLAGASLLMLDEPAAGLNPVETQGLTSHLELLKARGVTLLIVEHDMHFVDKICDHVVVLNFGEKIAEGPLSLVQRDAVVRAAYLGSEAAA
ncbi:ABC transporter ATP-binding protein [Rhodopseudomonas palustris]|uniref:ABC transporter ATP-binding protein n=1 Tax=Rhodopseudomonas palustris TaxID=1076 RepID=UPI002ACEB3D0|nr:ABC transporter ATP-binding protein [Rhodopseudomonas palustris]WQH00328.1 ABC transporter ATP-binding protein [Rhodopseudomonas palustris]